MKYIVEPDSIFTHMSDMTIPVGSEIHHNDKMQLHREDGPAAITLKTPYEIAFRKWYLNGKLHREDGPAQEWEGCAIGGAFLQNGEFHRIGGPARINGGGDAFVKGQDMREWYIRGISSTDRPITKALKWKFLKADPECLGTLGKLSKDMQEWVCKTRPDLIGKIPDLHPDIARKYQHELELSHADL